MFGPRKNSDPLDTNTIPSIENDIQYLDSALKALPVDLANAIHEVYDPIREIFYDTLIDKIVDPNPQGPDIIFVPPDSKPGDGDGGNNGDDGGSGDNDDEDNKKEIVHPIILYPINFNDPSDPGKDPNDPGNSDDPNNPGDKDPNDDTNIYPIVLHPIDDDGGGDNTDSGNGDSTDEIDAPNPIILHPIPGIDGEEPSEPGDEEPGDREPEDPWDSEPGIWEEPDIKVEYLYPDIGEAIDREFIYLLSKLLRRYTTGLKDVMNNYFYNLIRHNLGQSEENIKFISNKMELTSNDILNHSKHLLDSSVKNENTAALRTEFFKNVFSIRESSIHIRSFFVSHELRKRYTNIRYSRGKSMPNSMSDAVLKKLNAQYEMQYRKSFENLFRYLESSLKVTDDILRLHIQDGLNKSTILKKGGIR